MTDDLDGAWKEALDAFFPAFLALLFPHVHAAVDWSRGYERLDKELQKIDPDADTGRRHADLLVKVWTRDGVEAWLLIHVEVQAWKDEDFPGRMYVYQYRIADAFGRDVVSLAVLADGDPAWRPTRFAANGWGVRSSSGTRRRSCSTTGRPRRRWRRVRTRSPRWCWLT